MLNKNYLLLSIALGTTLFFGNSALAAPNDELTKAEIKLLKETFKFSDEYIDDLVEDGTIQDYLSMKSPIVAKKTTYLEISDDGAKAEELTRAEFNDKVEEELERNKKLEEEEEVNSDNLALRSANYDKNDRHDYITLETWFIHDEVNGDAQASARFEFADNSSNFGFTGKLYDDLLAIQISENASLLKGSEKFSLKYWKYGHNGKYDEYGNPVYKWDHVVKDDNVADFRDSGGYSFDAKYPELNTEKAKYIKNIRGYMKVEVVPRGSRWNGEMYDVWSHYLHAQKEVKLSYGLSLPPGGSITWEYEDVSEKVTGHVQERIYD